MFDPAAAAESVWLRDLNPAQRAAVEHGTGPLLVIAGAGSGKTRTLAARVAHLIGEGASPDRILLLTFTRRAAAEMMRRAGGLLADGSTRGVWGGTFHGIANRLLRHYGPAVGLRDGFTVIDQSDSAALFGMLRTELDLVTTVERFPRQETIAAIYTRTVNTQQTLAEVLDQHFPWCRDHSDSLREIFRAYTARKRTHNVVDYDDLLLYWRAVLHAAPDKVQQLFDHVLVDEYQDTNRVQADILMALCGPAGNLTVVGDDAQAIYGFRAATVENILGFPDEYPTTTIVRLEQNYRSTPQILDVANRVIGESKELFPKALWSERSPGRRPALVACTDEKAQADYVCERVLELREQGTLLRDQAVLFRTGHHSDGLEVELARRNIPFVKFGGLKFLESGHVKDLLAALRILDNPSDELAWHRLLQTIPGIGPATAGRIFDELTEAAAVPGISEVDAFVTRSRNLPAESKPSMAELQSALTDISSNDTAGPAGDIDRLLPFFTEVLAHKYQDAAPRLADLETLAGLATAASTRSAFLADLVLDPPVSTSDLAQSPHLDDDYLILSTIHSAKGGEWDAVFLIHAADGNLPSDMSLNEKGGLEEERRLMYVALTRARNELHITVPQRFYHRRRGLDDSHSYGLPSRFLTGAAALCDARAVGEPESNDTARLVVDPVEVELERLWN